MHPNQGRTEKSALSEEGSRSKGTEAGLGRAFTCTRHVGTDVCVLQAPGSHHRVW